MEVLNDVWPVMGAVEECQGDGVWKKRGDVTMFRWTSAFRAAPRTAAPRHGIEGSSIVASRCRTCENEKKLREYGPQKGFFGNTTSMLIAARLKKGYQHKRYNSHGCGRLGVGGQTCQ